MRDCPDLNSPKANHVFARSFRLRRDFGELSRAERSAARRRGGRFFFAVVASALAVMVGVAAPERAAAQEVAGFDPGAPQADFGGGAFFSQELGTLLRLRYNTKSYGQEQDGNFDIGTMQVVNFDDAIAFFDGQVTLNDYNGPGYNLGLGFRWLDYVPFMWEPERITGVSLWADGMHTEAGTFFPQVGVSYESLGDLWDIRVNGYLPVGPRTQNGKFELTGETGFIGNSLSQLTEAPSDTAFDEAEIEIARRLGSERDAWAFGGGYVLNSGSQDTAGYRLGLRGYAYPDLLLQIAVSDDDIFKTNAAFQIIWFVGRTRTDYQPTCGLPDRFREPVMRNDYVVLGHRTATGGVGLTDPNGEAIRVVHVDSAAPDGGDGTFEDPLNNLDDIQSFSQDGDIVYVWSESTFSGQAAVLQDNQQMFGEGDGVTFGIQTAELGTIALPETSPGAADAARPIILNALGSAVTLADANQVINFTMDGGTNGIVAGTNGAGSPTLSTLSISNMTGNGIDLTPFVEEDPDTGDETVQFNVTISDVDFDNNAGTDIRLDAETMASGSGVTRNEAIAISNVTSTNNGGFGINIENTHDGGSVMLTDWSYTGGIDALRLNNFDSELTMGTSTVTDNVGFGVNILGESGGTFTFNGTNTWENLSGIAFDVGGTFTGSISMQDDITNSTDFSVRIQGMDDTASITFLGNITDTGDGVRALSNNAGSLLFAGDLDLDTETDAAVSVTDNADTTINFAGLVDITTTTGNGFVATGGGTLGVSGNANTITTTTGGTGLTITGMTIASGGVSFADLNVAAGATNGILLSTNTGGPITVGLTTDEAGDAGVIAGTTGDAIVIENSANATISGIRVNNTNAVSGVRVAKTTTGTQTVNLNSLEINDGDIGVEVVGDGGASDTLNMTLNDSNVLRSTVQGLSVSNVDAGTTTVNDTTFDGESVNATAGGVLIAGSNATFNFNEGPDPPDMVVQGYGGTAFEVDSGTASVNMAGQVSNTTNRSIFVHDKSGGNVLFSGDVTDTGTGIRIMDNTGGTVSVLGNTTVTADTNVDAVVADNNDNSSVNFADLTITASGTGRGFVATGGGTLGVTGSTNTITTATGTGLEITDMTIANSGVNFVSVDVNGAANGIVLTNLTGGQVAVGSSTGAADSGGTLTTTGDAIVLSNVANVDLNNVHIANSGGVGVNIDQTNTSTTNMDVTIDGLNLDSSTGIGIDVDGADNGNSISLRLLDSVVDERVTMDITGTSAFLLLVENTQVTTTGTDIAFDLNFAGSAQNGDITIRNNTRFEAANASAMEFTANGTNIDIEMRIDDVDFQNNSNAVGSETGEFDIGGGATVDATVVNNSFLNSGTAAEYSMTSDGTATRTNLDLNNNTAGAGGIYELNTVNPPVGGFNFGVVDRDQADANNIGTINFSPLITDFEDIDGPLPQPTVP